jgi:hypothetical protein
MLVEWADWYKVMGYELEVTGKLSYWFLRIFYTYRTLRSISVTQQVQSTLTLIS